MSSLFADVGHRKLFAKNAQTLFPFEVSWFVKYLVKFIELGVDVTSRYSSSFWYQILFNTTSYKRALDLSPLL